MAFKAKGNKSYKTKVRRHPGGPAVTCGCGTTDVETARAVEAMLVRLKRDRQWAVIDAIMAKKMKLTRVFDLYESGQLYESLKKESSPDLVPMIESWKAGIDLMSASGTGKTTHLKYEIQIRAMLGDSFRAIDFTPKNIGGFLRNLDVSGSTRNKYHSALSVFADFLVEEEVLAHNPLRLVKRFPENAGREVWFDFHDDAEALVNALPQPFKALEAFMLATGAEWQACIRLRRRGVVLGTAPQAHAHGGKKPWRNRTVIPTDLWAWKIFEDYARDFAPNALLFGDLSPTAAIKTHQRTMVELGLDKLDHPPMRIHDLRHCYAVFALKAGLPLHIVARQLGHKDTVLCQRLYGRFVPVREDYERYMSFSGEVQASPFPRRQASGRLA